MGYRVVEAHWTDRLTDNRYANAHPNAQYLVVQLAVVNLDKKARMIPPFHLIDERVAEYDASSHSVYLKDALGALDNLNPEVAKLGSIVFDVRTDHTYKLKLSGGYRSRDEAYVELRPEAPEPDYIKRLDEEWNSKKP